MTDFDMMLDRFAELVAEKVAAKLPADGGSAPEPPADQLLTATEAAQMLGVKVRWLYRVDLPFRIKLPGRGVRYSKRGIARYIAKGGR